jgi:hypothetical protein
MARRFKPLHPPLPVVYLQRADKGDVRIRRDADTA